ncbi:MAG: hypothetical protein SPL13_00940 [Clostridia bacterium]|nr:hypothetical protein [Clostridia bacterium]
MPYTLSEQEKQNFTAQYLRNVERINAYLPDNLKITADLKELNKRLNDPKEQRLYKRALEIKEKEERRQDLYDQLADENRYLRTKGKTYALDRVIQYQFAMENDPNAAAYNQNVIRNYYLHPEAMVQQEFKKLLKYDPTLISQIAKSNDTENLLVEFYDKNAQFCEYAFALKGSIAAFNKGIVVDELSKNIESTASSYEMLKTASEMVQTVSESSFFVMPKLTESQKICLENSNIDIESPEFYDDVKRQIKCNAFRDVSVKEFKTFFKNLDKDGFKYKTSGGLNTLIAIKESNGGQLKNVPFTLAYLGNQVYAGSHFFQINQKEANIVQDVFKRDYIAEQNFVQHDFVPANANDYNTKIRAFKFQYAANINLPLYKVENMDLRDIVARHKGGFFEKTFGTTSKEFKDVMSQVDRFYDQGSEDYHQTESLAQVGQSYLNHKGVKTIDDIMKLSGTSKSRALFCYSLVETCKRTEFNRNFARDYVVVPERPIGIENTDLQNGQPAIVNIVAKEHAIPSNDILEDKPVKQTNNVNDEQNQIDNTEKNNLNEIPLEEAIENL